MLEELLQRFGHGDRLALSRLLSLASRGEHTSEIAGSLTIPAAPARVVAVTGAGGVGKSTLVGKLIEVYRARGKKIAVLACDPQSPVSGGALLGDRVRMPSRAEDPGVFIRSLAALAGREAVAESLPLMVRLLEAFGFEVIVIETAGAGQGDVAVRALADVVVLLLQPQTGDDLQWEKAGVLEVADVIVVHKADLPGADDVAAQVRATLELAAHPPVPVLLASAKTGTGVEELVGAVEQLPLRRAQDRANAELLRAAQDLVRSRFLALERRPSASFQELVARWQGGSVSTPAAASEVLSLLAGPQEP